MNPQLLAWVLIAHLLETARTQAQVIEVMDETSAIKDDVMAEMRGSIESMQRTIDAQESTIQAQTEVIELLKRSINQLEEINARLRTRPS